MGRFLRLLLVVSLPAGLAGQTASPTAIPPPDERFRADILLIVAHPDDDTLPASYLARAIYDEHRRVAVVFGTRGDAGGNQIGTEQAAALGAVREIEARRALSSLGMVNVWFLEGRDTASQDVLQSLERWGHGRALEQTVRLVRLTRPEIVLTWLPRIVAGGNHGDHQAAGVIATEAFDLAADPTAFPEQVAAPRDRRSIDNLTEGLRPWQAKKLYYFTDAFDPSFLDGLGPSYSLTQVSPSRGKPYAVLVAEAAQHYRTQFDLPKLRESLAAGDDAAVLAFLTGGDDPFLSNPLRLARGKSRVTGRADADMFDGIVTGSVADAAPPAPRDGPAGVGGLSVRLGGPWDFYEKFWRAHALESSDRMPSDRIAVRAGSTLRLPVLLRNSGAESREVELQPTNLPQGWTERAGSGIYTVPAGEDVTIQILLATPHQTSRAWYELTYIASSGGESVGSATLRVQLRQGGLPQ